MFSPKFRLSMVKNPFSQGYFPRDKMFQHFVKWKIEDVKEKRGLPFDGDKREKHLAELIGLLRNIIEGALKRLNFGILGFPALAMDKDDVCNDISFYIASTVVPRYNIKRKNAKNKNAFFTFVQNGIVFRILFFRKKSKRRAEKVTLCRLFNDDNSECSFKSGRVNGRNLDVRDSRYSGRGEITPRVQIPLDMGKYGQCCDRLEMVEASQSIMSTLVRFRCNFTMTERRVIDYILKNDDMMILHSSRMRDFKTKFRVSAQFKHLFMKKLGGLIEKSL